MEIGEKSKVGLSPDSHNAWEPAQDAGFHIPPATAAAGTMKVNTAEPLESRGCSDSCTEPWIQMQAASEDDEQEHEQADNQRVVLYFSMHRYSPLTFSHVML